MRLRLYHAPDGARVAYREAGTGPGLVLVHSALFTHRELEHRMRSYLDDAAIAGRERRALDRGRRAGRARG